ncbi:invasin, domain 3 [Kordia sp. SMS9]|uniref:Ig-like domain-containing protein n=1 Tax=Kordia sp. SMS9 TaxID=2282170 RepID=UPI000E0D71DC|nr:Ig-like domain-containing protein [Kordia sp. SMS9]AXG72242.1 invasin, domain 3 [Kordia sp. SMS9]
MALSNDFFIKKIKVNNSYAFVSFLGEVDGFFYWGTRSSVSSNKIALIKTDSNLELISVKTFTNGEVGSGFLRSIVRTPNGDRLIFGYYDNINAGASDKYCIIKLNSNDDMIWFKTYEHEQTIYSSYKMKLLPYGNNYIAWSNNLIFTIDSNGNVLRSMEETSSRFVLDLVAENGQAVVIGNGSTFPSGRRGVVSLAKLDGNLTTTENVEYSSIYTPSGPSGVGGAAFVNNGTLVSSANIQNRVFFLSFPLGSTFPQSHSAMWFDETTHYSSKMINTNDAYYRMNIDRTTSPSSTIVEKYGFDRVLQWSKTIDKASLHPDTFYALNNALLFIPFGVGYDNDVWDNKSVIKADTSLEENTCIRVNQNSNFTLTKENLVRETGSIAFQDASVTVQTYEALEETNLNNETVELCIATPIPDLDNSTITANPSAIPANGSSTSTITVQLKDADGNNITAGGETVQITTNKGTITPTIDNNDGTYTSILQSTSVEETAITSFSLNGTQSSQIAPVEFYILGDCYFTSSFRSYGTFDGFGAVCKLGSNRILAVGGNGVGGVVTLFNDNSEVVWRKRLTVVERTIGLSSVAPCPDGQSAIVLGHYATGQTNRSHLIVFRIDSNGNVIWSKLLYSPNTRFSTGLRTLDYSNGTQKYLITAWFNQSGSTDDMELYKLDENGNLLSSKKVAGISDEQIMGVVETPFGFTIVGSATTPAGQPIRHAIVLSFNDNLGLNWGKRLGDGTYIYATGAIATSTTTENYIVAGIQDNTNRLFISNFSNAVDSYTVKTTNLGSTTDKLSPSVRLVQGANDTFYCIANYTTDRASEVIKFNYQLNELWRKKLDFGSKNSISQLLNDADAQLLLVGGIVGTSAAYIAKTNLELQNCISENVATTPYVQETFTNADFAPTISDLPNTYQNIAMTATDLAAARTDYCSENCNTTSIPPSEHTAIQSPNFYLQAAGSTGNDGSTQGIHTRWVFSGALGEKHLPKGNYANTTNNFNKDDDFVRVYRTPYRKVAKVINFSQAPNIVDDANGVWIYRIEGKDFHVYFKNQTQYTQVRAVINPASNAQGFMQNYGNELIEIESKRHLFFAVEAKVSASASNSSLQTETLSVSTNTLIALKKETNRKTFASSALQNTRLVCENGRTFRCVGNNTHLTEVHIELYGDFIEDTNENQAWTPMGSYALTLDDTVALQQLEPSAGLVDGNWPRFNDDATVNIDNYINKWNVVEADVYDRNLKDVVGKYITLSDDINNPKAVEEIPVDENIVVEGEDDVMEISNLDMLNIASYDYHMARMLGLGFLDIASQVQQGEFVYIAEYVTFGDLEDGQGAREVQHLSMSLPTATSDERLPLPIELDEVVPGAFFGTETSEPSSITDDDGYTHDGRKRYVTLYAEEIPEDAYNPAFYAESTQFESKEYTIPIYAGLEYRKQRDGQPDPGVWEKPEISHDKRYLHTDTTVSNASERYEAFPITLPEVGQPIFVHKQIISGTHYYGSYGINWFSRATSSPTEVSIITALQPKNPLLPPSNIQPHLIQKEQPLLLTSETEQQRYKQIEIDNGPDADQTLVRISFDYHSYQELVDYVVPEDSAITDTELVTDTTSIFDDNDEIFAEDVDIFFRNEMPNNISGKVINIEEDTTNNLVSILTVDEYYLSSVDQTLTPSIPNGLESNYEGGVFIIGEQQHIIHEVIQTSGFPQFKVYKKEISDALVSDIPTADAEALQAIEITNDGIFMAIENMQTPASWGTPNPQPLHVKVDTFNQIHREVVMVEGDAGELERHLEKTRGIWSNPASNHTTITKVDEVIDLDTNGDPVMGHKGMYSITFHGIVLDQHIDYSETSDSVEWYRGIVRVHTEDNPNGKRKVLKVAKILNIKYVGDTTESDVQVLAFDPLFSNDTDYDPIQSGTNVSVNFYPGYKVYLYENQTYGLTEANLLPGDDEEVKNSIVGLRSHDTNNPYYSNISIPKIMFAQKIVEAKQPEQPDGAKYATRPDFFGRSTYTITTEYAHKPHGVLFYRANDEALLNALYEKETVLEIRAALKALGGNYEDYFANRWENFLDFATLETEGDYRYYPPVDVSPDHYKFPNPNKVALFEWANDIIARINSNTAFPPAQTITPFVTDLDASNTDVGNISVGDSRLLGFVKGVLFNAFVPLTKVPVVYAYINGSEYVPVNKKQVLRDENGSVLSPTDPAFEMAPMMKTTSTSPHTTQFTDFNLDGTSNNIYFYAARELSSQMKLGEFSRALGPIKLVTSNAPEAPEVKRIMPVLENVVLGTTPKIQLEINAYPEIQDIKKVNIYRAFNKLDAQSIRTMTPLEPIDVDAAGIAGSELWTVYDDFSDLDEVPYGDGLFYRLTVSRKIEYVEADYGTVTPPPSPVTKYAPSQASKIVASMMVEVANPPAPTLQYIAEPIAANGDINQIALQWQKTCYNGTYSVFKMNAQGNWVKIHEITTNQSDIFVLLEDTSLQAHSLATQDADGNTVYHHFKVVAQNTSGMQSTEENILTMPNDDNWIDIGGIGDMIIGTTFTIR